MNRQEMKLKAKHKLTTEKRNKKTEKHELTLQNFDFRQ